MNTAKKYLDGPVFVPTDQIVIFSLDELLYAIPLPNVLKIIHAIEIRNLPQAPEIISGIINLKGQIIPVADIRKRFGLPEHETGPDDHIIIADTGKRQIALIVDLVTEVSDFSDLQIEQAQKPLPYAKNIKGVAKIGDDLVLIYDLNRFLSLKEEKVLEHALNSNPYEA
jgi:purine-binding chemotaxis protein CheW